MCPHDSLDYGEFYDMYDPLANRPLRFAPQDDSLSVQSAIQLSRGELTPEVPIVFRAEMGGQPASFLWSTLSPLLCADDRVVSLLTENGFTGWSTYPVQMLGRKGEVVPGYHGFAVTGRGGERDLSNSPIVDVSLTGHDERTYKAYRGVYFKPEAWDGSDIFYVGGHRFVRKPVMQAFRKAKITNVRFTPLPEVNSSVISVRIHNGHNPEV